MPEQSKENPDEVGVIQYRQYADENDLPIIMKLVDEQLSEPYSIFTYRYFISQWPQLCLLAYSSTGSCVGTIVCKLDTDRARSRGYIAMLVVVKEYRGKGIATELVNRCIVKMQEMGCDEVALEAEVTNNGALALYGNLGFLRAKRLHRYYLNGVDAFRLKLLLPKEGKEELIALDERIGNGLGLRAGMPMHRHSHHGGCCGHAHH